MWQRIQFINSIQLSPVLLVLIFGGHKVAFCLYLHSHPYLPLNPKLKISLSWIKVHAIHLLIHSFHSQQLYNTLISRGNQSVNVNTKFIVICGPALNYTFQAYVLLRFFHCHCALGGFTIRLCLFTSQVSLSHLCNSNNCQIIIIINALTISRLKTKIEFYERKNMKEQYAAQSNVLHMQYRKKGINSHTPFFGGISSGKSEN